ncbi:type IV secretion system protein VirD4 [Antricoccus suffuscus]|uniref:Type IV secretion system protein VirD4 n=1 Tax=Antricoccus suffuscus TaxID=1629062 RepID=A0A2T0ZF69_9ACTN|nr:TraG/TraD/VirD4 family protein [Antricoccus suffuscus]PRZ34814.1 type IV secretion system protein VirD4 [Antricoccus suffuscus]
MRRVMLSSGRRSSDPGTRQLAAIGVLIAAVVAAWASASVAVWLSSGLSAGRWRFPAGVTWIGRAITGRPMGEWFTGPGASPHPSPASVSQVAIIAVLLFVVLGAALTVAAVWLVSYFRTYPGMATTSELSKAYGPAALWKGRRASKARELRPDLFEPPAAGPAPVEEGASRPSRPKRSPRPVAYSLGRAVIPRGVDLWAPLDQAAMVLGPPGSGKTLAMLLPAFAAAPGGRLFATTKLADIYLAAATIDDASAAPVIFDPLGQSAGIAPLVWDPVAGCVNSHLAERRARAFAAGTVTRGGHADDAARFYMQQASTVIAGLLHAAALSGRTIEDVVSWSATGSTGAPTEAEEILRQHPHAERTWADLLAGSTRGGDDRTVGNTWTTVRQALSVFQHHDVVARCTPTEHGAATDLDAAIAAAVPILVIGKDDEYSSVTPLLTAVIEDILDRVESAADRSAYRRLAPPFLAAIDELPNTAPIPTLPQRVADGRGRGLCVLYAAQGYAQLATRYGENVARALSATTNVWCIFGGSKDSRYNKELSDLIGTVEVSRASTQHDLGMRGSRQSMQLTREDKAVIEPHDLLTLPQNHAIVLAGRCRPAISRFRLLVRGSAGKELLASAAGIRSTPQNTPPSTPASLLAQTQGAVAESRARGIVRTSE